MYYLPRLLIETFGSGSWLIWNHFSVSVPLTIQMVLDLDGLNFILATLMLF